MGNTIFNLQDVSKHYPKDHELICAVDHVSLQVQAGDFIAIQGASGSGKSTLLHLLGALDRPTSGQIYFANQDFTDLSDYALSRLRCQQFGFVFQSFNLIPDLTVLQNVALPQEYLGVSRAERNRVAEQKLAQVGMAHRLSHHPSELSGGEEQRVAIARALVNRPAVLLADEPTGNLDTQNRRLILDLFQELHDNGQTLIVVTHDPVVADAARQKWIMQAGRLQQSSDPLCRQQ